MYFCKNCGEPYMTDEAVMCVKCGVAKGQGNNYCHNCGKPLAPDAAVCLNCGVANKQAPAPDAKSKLVAGLLAIFLGTFGVHNFYLGYTGKAVTQLVLSIVLGCCTGWIGALFGIGGIICAVFANKQGKTGLAKAGLICSIIGIVLGIIITILAAVFSVAFMSELTNY